MAYSIWVECSHCHNELEESTNYTYNIAPILSEVGLNLSYLNGDFAMRADFELSKAIKKLEKNSDKYRLLNPKNGWGDYDSMMVWLKKVRDQCQKYPDAIFRVS